MLGTLRSSGGCRKCLVANGMECRYHDGGLDWLPCLGGRDFADGLTLYSRFHGSMVAEFCPDIASRFQFFRGGYPSLAGSKCLGSGELQRPAGVEWLCLIVSLRLPVCFWVHMCPPEIRSLQCVLRQPSGPPPPPFPLGRRRGQQLPPCLYIDDSERSLCQYGPELIRGPNECQRDLCVIAPCGQ